MSCEQPPALVLPRYDINCIIVLLRLGLDCVCGFERKQRERKQRERKQRETRAGGLDGMGWDAYGQP